MKEIQFAIHDLNQQGGQDRSTLEILLRLHKKLPIQIHAFTVSDQKLHPYWKKIIWNIQRPVLLKILFYYFVLFVREFFHLFQSDKRIWVWHATGASHLRSKFVHLQFIHASWRNQRKIDKTKKNKNIIKLLYAEGLEHFNIVAEKICFREGKVYMAISQSVADDLKKYYRIQKNVYVVHHGVDTKKFFPLSREQKNHSKIRTSLGISHDTTLGILVGSYERKGLEASIKAISMVKKSCREFKLLAVGDGDTAYFKKLISSLNLDENIILVPKQRDILDYYQASDFFLLPTQYEPFGLVITEALACGLPTIVSKCAGGSELITNQEQGFLIHNPNDPAEIASHIENLLDSKETLDSMSKKARALAEKRSWDQVSNEFEAIFKKHLGENF